MAMRLQNDEMKLSLVTPDPLGADSASRLPAATETTMEKDTMTMLRKAGDFPNRSVVEFSTVKVKIAHRLIPINLRNEHYEDEDIVKGLSVSLIRRLSFKTLYLDSEELAQAFAGKLADLFKNRPYRGHYQLVVSVEQTMMTVTANKGKIKHSA
ncbi:hypothetical protein [Pseudomonas cerasi]|uniref:Uncharacterized protein n=1 Tax=Pseudomonas cerasi TaxID=1583341 RepID=A0A193SGK9_9PSED|nr:hypothetical protein [Pseudomonas cerasi]CZT26078.1 hypothetical protein PCPL58_p2061 [Pseudomonas cerasi]SOS30410.1 hypothetical protein PL963_P400038 [Pseudomonas cerasi]